METSASTRNTPGWRVPKGLVRAWRRVFRWGHRFEDRLVHLVVALLMAVQLASFLCMRFAIDEAASRSLRDELQVGARVLDRLLLTRGQQLTEAATVLASDFGLREAVSTGDRKTVLSALENHASRFKASRMVQFGLDGTVVADSANPNARGYAFAHFDLTSPQGGLERGPAIRVLDGRPFQVVTMPVRAPHPIGWVALMRAIDDDMARDLERLVNARVAVVVHNAAATRVVATTLGDAAHRALGGPIAALVREGGAEASLDFNGTTYRALSRRLDESGGERIHAVLLRSSEEAGFPYRALEATALVLTAIALALTLFGSIRIARRVSRPVTHMMRSMADGKLQRDLMRARLGRVREQRDDLTRVMQDLAQQATHDPLTGLANRRALELHMAGWDAERRPVAFLMIEVDQFREVAERHSQLIADHVLQTMASILRAACRPSDFAARYASEVFLVAVTRPDPGSGRAVAERLREAVAAHPWDRVTPDVAITVSIGLAEARAGVPASLNVRRADMALSDAKRRGRNQVLSASGSHSAIQALSLRV